MVPQHMNTMGGAGCWKQDPPRHSSREKLEVRLEVRLQHESEGSTQEIGLATDYLQCKSKVQAKEAGMDKQTDRQADPA